MTSFRSIAKFFSVFLPGDEYVSSPVYVSHADDPNECCSFVFGTFLLKFEHCIHDLIELSHAYDSHDWTELFGLLESDGRLHHIEDIVTELDRLVSYIEQGQFAEVDAVGYEPICKLLDSSKSLANRYKASHDVYDRFKAALSQFKEAK